MRGGSGPKTLGDVKTSISTHGRSAPRREGSAYLEAYLLGREKQRLETELALLAKRQRRIAGRLGEIQEAMEEVAAKARQASRASRAPAAVHSENSRPAASGAGAWRRMTLEY